MDTLKKIVSNQYFPAAAVLTAVLLFWAVGLLGGLSLLHNNQPPLTTLTWMLFVYTAAVLTPLAGILAAADLLRRWRRNRDADMAYAGHTEDQYSVAQQVVEAEPGEAQTVAQQVVPEHADEEPAVQHAAPPAPKASRPKKTPKQAGRKQAA
ncbi:hypothetical protein [Arthrobacter sp. OY3WO11]|uniref:hypothetical protein n=1 Tax=Arthrobacter sp. OY3WO11 TaxID=1835723 RepID=UPI0007CF248E|nr:hypothetical protein [Arthrobacter sp. OY3WO11]OAE01122.1 hypothetical protein A6A22_06530 [Arthrobacter sp. OY3WO11]